MDKLGRGWILVKLGSSFGAGLCDLVGGQPMAFGCCFAGAGVFAVAVSNYRIIKKLEGQR